MNKARHRTLKRHAKQFPWQRTTDSTPQWEREYIGTLTQGLEASESIGELIQGLAIWLLRVGELEKERNKRRIIVPGVPEDRIRLN